MSGSQIQTSVTILNSLLGFQAISLTNFDSSAESVIAAGSKIEIAGAFFTFDSDETPQASTWTAISTGSTAYITCTPSGTAGSQIVTVKYTESYPIWRDSLQGYYASAASSTRFVAGVVKTGTSSYESAHVLPNRHGELATMIIEIGDWNMDANGTPVSTHLYHGLATQKIRAVQILIRADSDGDVFDLQYHMGLGDSGNSGDWYYDASEKSIRPSRVINKGFDSANFNATSYNRGWVRIEYQVDG